MLKTRMSRGLGKMQHLILASLKPAKQAHVEGKLSYIGAASFANVIHQSDHPAETLVRQGGEFVTLDEGFYDLRATLRYLAIRLSERPGKRKRRPVSEDLRVVDNAFRITFMRAARNLVERGLLIRCDDEDAVQLRFVSVAHPQTRQKIPAPELTRSLRALLSHENNRCLKCLDP
jgi:hypothetical protein